jgi:O-antigen/teichoic acid export membrane protein
MDFVHEERNDLKNIFNRFRKRDFSGTTGEAMKNSSYQLAQNLMFKIGSLIFTIIIARMLLPDKMGLYNLSLTTIVLFASFSDLGIGSALITFGARYLGKKNLEKTKGYAKKLFKWKLWLVFIASGILLLSSYFIAEFYYQKPIFYAILVGVIYLPISEMVGFVENLFKTSENFKLPLFKEILFQIIRFILVPLTIFIFLKSGLSDQGLIVVTLLALVVSYSITLFFLISKAKIKINFLKVQSKDLNKKETRALKKFIYPLSATAMAGLFFGYIDTLMLGRHVLSEFIAYYGAAFSLVSGAAAIIGFMSVALMPIFAKKSGKALEDIFRKTRNLTILISVAAGIFTYFIAYYVIRVAYGMEYLSAVPILQWFSILVVLLPILGIYVIYYATQRNTITLAWLIVGSAVLNIIFNLFGIKYGLNKYGMMGAVYGAVVATILSRILYLTGLIWMRKRK